MRLHSPPCAVPEPDAGPAASLRVAEHTDFGMFTYLFLGEGARGLQVKPVEGGVVTAEEEGWLDAVVPDGAASVPGGSAIVNTGAQMAMWTNDVWRATAHRVVVPDAEAAAADRYSIALFWDPDAEARIEVHPSLVPAGEEPKYPPTTGLEFLMKQIRAGIVAREGRPPL